MRTKSAWFAMCPEGVMSGKGTFLNPLCNLFVSQVPTWKGKPAPQSCWPSLFLSLMCVCPVHTQNTWARDGVILEPLFSIFVQLHQLLKCMWLCWVHTWGTHFSQQYLLKIWCICLLNLKIYSSGSRRWKPKILRYG